MMKIKYGPIEILDQSRRMGMHMVAPRGHGKSRLLGRGILYQDFIRDDPIATVVIDPVGQMISNFLDKVGLDDRVRYIDMTGRSGYVAGFPLYYRYRGDTLRDVAYRFIAVLLKN